MMPGLCVPADRSRAAMKIKLDRIVSIATLVVSCVAIVLVLKKPAPVAQPQTPAAIAANAQSFGQKMEQFEQATQQPAPASGVSYQPAPVQNQPATSSNQPKAEVHLNSDEVGAALAQAVGAAGASGAGAGELSPDSNLGGLNNIDAGEIGAQVAARWTQGANLLLAFDQRADVPPERKFHLHYEDLVAAPLAAIARIYAHFDMKLGSDSLAAMSRHCEARPRGGYGKHAPYLLENFKLSRPALQAAFAPYVQQYCQAPR